MGDSQDVDHVVDADVPVTLPVPAGGLSDLVSNAASEPDRTTHSTVYSRTRSPWTSWCRTTQNPFDRLSRMHVGENENMTGLGFPPAWPTRHW